MKEARIGMGMPIIVDVADERAGKDDLEAVFSYFEYVDRTFSTYKEESEISRINRGELPRSEWSADMREVFALSEETKRQTGGFFDIMKDKGGAADPSGLVKGWAVRNAAALLRKRGFRDFFVEAGGDIEAAGRKGGRAWRIGIQDPRDAKRIVKTVCLSDRGIATSGNYIRGDHIWNPHAPGVPISGIVSLTVIGPDVYEADRFATAAFAMGKAGIRFLERLTGFEAYLIAEDGIATMTSGFEKYAAAA